MNDNKMKMIDNIDQKLNVLYKNLSKEEFYNFIDNNKEVKAYNELLNNIALNILPTSYLSFLPLSVLVEINNKVFMEFTNLLETNKELVLV